jgi:two-component system response regulator NreC
VDEPSGEKAISVVLADDHTVMRNGLRMLLDAERDIEVVAEADSIGRVFERVRWHRPAVLVLDLKMPGGSSIAAIPKLVRVSSDTAVVVLTMEEDPVLASEAIRAGAHGFVRKDAASDELVRAIRAAATGARSPTW